LIVSIVPEINKFNSFWEIARGGTIITMLPKVLKYTPCFFPSSKIFERYYNEISQIEIVGDIRHKGMLMGIELVKNKRKKIPFKPKKSINRIIFEEGKKHGVYFRTLGNIVMIVPPLAISQKELNLLISGTIETIKSSQKQLLNNG